MRSVRRLLVLSLLAAAPAAPADLLDGHVGGAVGASTSYVFRGLTESDSSPSAQADVHYYLNSGAFAGLWAATVKRNYGDSTTGEFNLYLGYAWPLASSWDAKLVYVHYDYPWNQPHRSYAYDELSATVGYDGRVYLSVSASPDTPVDTSRGSVAGRAALAYDLALHQPLPRAFSLNAGVGYYDLRWAAGTGYVYWNAGLGYALGPVQLDLSYIGTNGVARRLFYPGVADEFAVRRLVASAIWRF